MQLNFKLALLERTSLFPDNCVRPLTLLPSSLPRKNSCKHLVGWFLQYSLVTHLAILTNVIDLSLAVLGSTGQPTHSLSPTLRTRAFVALSPTAVKAAHWSVKSRALQSMTQKVMWGPSHRASRRLWCVCTNVSGVSISLPPGCLSPFPVHRYLDFFTIVDHSV